MIECPPTLAGLSRRVHELLDIPWRETAHGELAGLLPGQPDLHGRVGNALVLALRHQWPVLERQTLPVEARDGLCGSAPSIAGHDAVASRTTVVLAEALRRELPTSPTRP